jgi:hypothetical protein
VLRRSRREENRQGDGRKRGVREELSTKTSGK